MKKLKVEMKVSKNQNKKDPKITEIQTKINELKEVVYSEDLDGNSWLEYMKSQGNQLTPAMKFFCSKAWYSIEAPREGTVGSYLLKKSTIMEGELTSK